MKDFIVLAKNEKAVGARSKLKTKLNDCIEEIEKEIEMLKQ